MYRCSALPGKRSRREITDSNKLFTPASTTILSPTDSDASSTSNFSGCNVLHCPSSDEFEHPLHQRKRFKAASLCDYDTSSYSGSSSQTFSSPLNQASLGTFTHASADPCHRWDIPFSGRLAFPQGHGSGALCSLPSNHSCLGSLQIASQIASSSTQFEGSGVCGANLYRFYGTEPLTMPSSSGSSTWEHLYTQPLKQLPFRDLSACPRPPAEEWAPQGRLCAPYLRTSLARSAPGSSHPLQVGHIRNTVPAFLRMDVPHVGLPTSRAKQAIPGTTAWQSAALPRPQLPLATPKCVLAKWGSLLQLAPDTLFFTEHLFTRLRPQHFFGRLDWTTLLLLLGCLWIACKLEECRLSIPAAHTIAGLVGSSMGVAVSAALVNAVEVRVLSRLQWRPLAGWDDLTHVKGRLLVSPTGAW